MGKVLYIKLASNKSGRVYEKNGPFLQNISYFGKKQSHNHLIYILLARDIAYKVYPVPLFANFAPSLFQILHSVKAWNYNGNRNNMQENFFLKVY